ncbi:MAG TPA: peptidylprolyl isomerase [Alphaproteobacteria bacterium]|nr:peptidylprolyl isomerase [Alphaproteobacteria bacterium]
MLTARLPVRLLLRQALLCLLLLAVTLPAPSFAQDQAPRPKMTITLETGKIVIELRPDKAPKTVARIRELANSGFYDKLTVIRVAKGHVVQMGDPLFNGEGGSGQLIPAEFNDLKHLRGAVGMARDEDPNSADSQFYICTADRPHLDGQYTVFGQVLSGMELLDAMKPGDGPMGFILEHGMQPKILSVRVEG